MNKLILFLHGYGANGADLIGLKEYINNKEENIIFESPNAPEPCPLNYFGYQWFDLVERTPEEIFHGLKKSYSYLDKIITEMTSKHNIKTEQIMLIGFSQGAMLASYYGLLSKNNLAGVISLSGSLPKIILDTLDKLNIKQKFSIFHGRADSVIPFQRAEEFQEFLKKKKISNNIIIEENQEHGISDRAIREIQDKVHTWLQ